MEAGSILRSVRAYGGLTQSELARMADVAPSTVSRIERGELEPTWSLMNRLIASAGYESKNGLVSAGDVSAVAAARAALGELARSSLNESARSWIERWVRARFVDSSGLARDVEKLGVQAGIASRLFDRPNEKLSVIYDKPWQDTAAALRDAGVRYAVTGITATSPTRVVDGAAWPLIYVDSIPAAVSAAGLLPQTTSGPRVTLIKFDDVAATGTVEDNGITFVSPGQALIDSYAGPGRMADQADAIASDWRARQAA